MEKVLPALTALVLGWASLAACTASTPQRPAPAAPAAQAHAPQGRSVNPQGQAVLEFRTRLDRYVELRNAADNTAKRHRQTAEPADIRDAQQSLAERIGVARKGAQPGDIFTPEIAALFRTLLKSGAREAGTREQIRDDNPGAGVPFRINGPYPDTEPLATMPPNVLETLPPLPEDIEYRFVQKHLILRDARANLIIDYLRNAIP